uniref:Putative glycosyltransferase n=1 Tax=viral metagenome TaxID=1070528 RepID=A0A6M3LFN3_9ZZZZ
MVKEQTGIMTNILCVSLYDNGGSLQQLTHALNAYTLHDARHLNFKQTWLKYDVDIKASDYRNEELNELFKDRDFFIFSELIPDRFKELDFYKKLNRENTIIRCFGSTTRNQVNIYRSDWTKCFWTYASGGFDPTIHPYLGFVAYHIPNIYEFSDFPAPHKNNNKIKVCQAVTNKDVKSTTKVVDTLWKLEQDYGIDPIIISGIPWKDTLKIKASCHITIDQFKLGTYASSAIESMYLRNAVVSRISPFVRSMHPDIPIVNTTEETLSEAIIQLISEPERMFELGEKGHKYAMKEHDAKTNIAKWDYLIQWVHGGFI